MTNSPPLPLIGVATSMMQMPGSQFTAHVSGKRYINSLNKFSECIAVQIPSLGEEYDYADLVARFDGIVLTVEFVNGSDRVIEIDTDLFDSPDYISPNFSLELGVVAMLNSL